jgi:hypothetical protein
MRGGTLESMDLSHYYGRANWRKKHPAGRVCAEPGCGTVLSVYNETDRCGLHQPEPDDIWCGYRVVICAACGHAVAIGRSVRPSRKCGRCGAAREEVRPMPDGAPATSALE